MQEDNYKKFKCLLEYFVSHLEWVVNEDSNHPGYKNYIEPIQDFKKDGRGYDQNKHYKIQDQISPWCKYGSDVVYINCDARRIQSKSSYLNWNLTWINIRPNWQQMNGTSHVSSLYLTKEEGTNAPTELSMSLEELGLFDNSNPNHNLKVFFNQYNSFLQMYNSTYNNQKYLDLLKSNHNLILTGAPGTGKTYLAKQIAKAMGCTDNEIGFVQFHPSYDYTDFVEGLRPAQDKSGNVGFVRKDGVFKAFCRKALKNVIDSKKTPQELKNEKTFKEKYDEIIGKIENGEIDRFDLRTGVQMDVVEVSEKDNIILRTHGSDKQYTVSFGRLSQLAKKFPDVASLNSITNIDKTIRDVIKGCHTSSYWAVLKAIYEQCSSDENEIVPNEVEEKKYVFIIDEINRGEISKIFGELFFSIDPGYRGIDGKVRTQYANMQTDPNVFDEALGINDSYNCGHFFVPENVYIIGTMNDIDRSVESMDFAFRRRFAFKEITAEESKQMLDSENAWGKDENGNSRKPDQVDIDIIKSKMDAINNVIWHKVKEDVKDEDKSIEGLSSAYHIGASYFLKLVNYKNTDGSYDYDQLWENHLEGLLLEYMRGMADTQKKIKKLANAYGYSKMNKYE